MSPGFLLYLFPEKPKRFGIWYTSFMPTVLRIGALRVVIYPNDHRPAHVHVIGNGHEAVFEMKPALLKPLLRENYGFSRRDLAAIERALAANRAVILAEWERIHGAD
jgi:hypothetical protein